MSLSNCLKEAGKSISKEDKAALRKKVTAIREEAGKGDDNKFILAKADADIQAIEETLAVLTAAQSDVMARAVAKTSGQGDILGSLSGFESVGSDAAQALREEQKAKVIAVLRKNSAMAESLDSGKLQVVDSSERESLGEGWAMAFDDNGMRGAYKQSTGQAVIFSDRVSADQDAVSIGYHEMLHAAEGYAEESGSGRFDMLMGDQRSALYRRLNLLRQFGNPREKKVLQDAYDLFVASGDSDGDLATRESEWMAYAIQAIVASKAEKGSLAKWTGDARLAVQQTLRKLLRIKVTPDNLSMREFASLAELAIRETADSAGAETRQAAQDKKAEERQAAQDKKAEERQAAQDKKAEERDAKRTAKEAELRAKGEKAQEAAAAKEARDAKRQAEKEAKAAERQAEKEERDAKRQAEREAKAAERRAKQEERQARKEQDAAANLSSVEQEREALLVREKAEQKKRATDLEVVRQMIQKVESEKPLLGTPEYAAYLSRRDRLKARERELEYEGKAAERKYEKEYYQIGQDAELDTEPPSISRRRFMRNLVSLAVTAAVVGDSTVGPFTASEMAQPEGPPAPEATLERGKFKIISSAIRQRLSEKTLQAIRDNDFVAALESAKEGMPQDVVGLIDGIMSLLPDPSSYDVELGGYAEYKGGKYRLPSFANGNTLRKGLLTIYEENEQGNDVDTLLHEAMHLVINARYSTLFAAKGRTYDLTGLTRPQAEEAIAQFRNLHREFKKEVARLEAETGGIEKLSVPMQVAKDDIDEFFIRAMTDPAFQLELYNIDYNGKTLLQRFKDWVKISLFGSKSGNTPTWLDAAMIGITDVLNKSYLDAADFSTTLGIESYNEEARKRNQARKDKAANADSSDSNDILASRKEMWEVKAFAYGESETLGPFKTLKGARQALANHLGQIEPVAQSYKYSKGSYEYDGRHTIEKVKPEFSADSSDILASRDSNNTTLLPNADYETVMRVALASEDGNASANESLNDFFARKAGYKDAEAYNKALREEMDGFEAMLENPDALKAALYLEGEERNSFENTTGDIKKIIGGVLAEKAGLRVLRDNKRYKLYEKTAQEMTALELVEAIDEAFDVGTAQERGARKGISLAPDTNDILASRRALSQESPGTDKYKAAVDKFGQEGMTKEARTARAEEQGFTMDAYSGSTFDIEAFDGSISSPQNNWGRGSYASTSIEDVNSNYAGIGPDLTTRIEIERDNVESVMSFDDNERDMMLEEAGVPLEDYLDDPDETHWNLAAKELVGEAELGVVYPLKIKTGNYLEMDRRTSTILEADSVGEMSERINEALFETDLYPNDQVAMDGILEEVFLYIKDQNDGETVEYPSYDLDAAVRVVVGNNGPAIGYDGEPVAPGEISAQLFRALGYEGVIDRTINDKFGNRGALTGGMEGVDADTVHIITFPGSESNLRSTSAAFDPDNSGSSDILASRKAPETPEFQRWFEGSKVVDQDGDPLVVYHATESEFTEFQVPAMFSRKRDYVESMGRPRIISAYLSIKNPADLRAMQISPSDPDFGAIAEDLKRQGYDGAQYRDEAYVAFEASQIKSTENTGEFSADSGDILASRKAPIGKTGRPYQAVRANKVKGGEDRVQTSLPSGKKNKVDYYIKGAPEDYSIGVDRILSVPEVAEKHKNTINGYDFFTPSRSDLTAEETINEFKQFMVNNLIWLHNQMDPKIRETARKWYDGARKNVDVWAARYGVESRQVAAVIANLSPQKDWFMNMSLAERIMDIHTYRQDVAADKDMNKAFDRVVLRDDKGKLIMVSKNPRKGESKKVKLVREYRSIWAAIKDAKLSDVRSLVSEDDGNLAAAIWVRMYDEAKHSRQYRMMKPTGEIIGFAMNDDGVTPASVAWGSFTEIAKAMAVLQDGSLDSVSMSLGGAHKVRNFYNNIIAPNSNLGEVTIDTHAVGAALFKPMSAKSYEVAHAFGSTPKDPKGGPDAIPEGVKRAGAGSSEANGIGGTYGIMADAYREAAAELGLLPRELQSITWEEIRVIYPASFKDDKLVNLKKINALWKQFAEGKMTLAKVRKAAYGLAKTKGNVPGWASRPNSARDDRTPNGTYSRDVYDDGVPRQVGGRGGRTAGRSRGDVARTRRASARGRAGQLDSDILGSRRNDGDQSKLEGLADLLASQTPPSGRLPTVKNALNKTKKMVTQMPELLAVLPRRALAEVAPKEMPSAAQTVRQAEQMDADRNQILSDAGEVLNLWHRWARKNKPMARKLHTLMHDTTLVGYDPSKPYKSLLTEQEYLKDMARLKKQYKAAGTPDQRKRYADLIKALETKRADERARKNAKPKLDKRWNALSPEAKKLYTQVRDEYGKQRQAMFKELKARIERAEMTETVRTAMSDKLRIAFESNTVRGPYFPLSRFGDHFVVFNKVVDGKNKVQEFRMFESEGQANEYLSEMETKHPDWVGQKGAKDDQESTFQQVDPEYAEKVASAIQNKGDIDRAARFELADQVWQLYLQTLPEMSIRKQSIHRGAVKGWDEDAMRGYASIALHHAHHITKLRHGDLLRGLLAQSKKEANTLRDKGYGDRINKELERGINWAMNPTNASWASTLTGLGFAYQLAVSPAAAMINTMQTPMVGIPYIGSRFGFAKTSAEFAKATKEFSGIVAANAATRVKDKTVFLDNDLKTHWSGKLKGDELAFYNEMVRRSLFEKTRAHDLAGISDQGMNRSMNSRVWLDRMSATFHNAEVFNREVTAMVAYRMAKKNKLSHEDALAYAYKATLDVHFDYSNAGRPRVIRLPVTKVVGQYKQYAINMSFRVLRDAYVAVNLSPEADPEVKREMVRRSLASLVLSFTFAGFQGFFGYSVIKMVYELFENLFGDEDEPKSFEGDVRQGLYNTISDHLGEDSEETARLLSDILWAGPVDTYFGGSIGLRVAPDIFRLFVQLQDNGKEGRDAYIHFMAQMAGPVVGGVAGMAFDANNLYFNDDEPWKAAEKIVPKFVRDPMKAWRYALEGATNSEGNTIIPAEDFSAWDLALQANGFAPSDLQKQYDLNRVEMTRDRALEDRKEVLMRNARKDVNKNGAVSAETVTAIQRFNSMNPTIAITGEGITSSVKNKARRAALNIGGQQRDGKGPTPYNF